MADGCVVEALGRDVGAVVVDPGTNEVVAVAGDARWFGRSNYLTTGNGNQGLVVEGRPEYHALMRAIAMVADKEDDVEVELPAQ